MTTKAIGCTSFWCTYNDDAPSNHQARLVTALEQSPSVGPDGRSTCAGPSLHLEDHADEHLTPNCCIPKHREKPQAELLLNQQDTSNAERLCGSIDGSGANGLKLQ
jgi:hypothetical protein